MLLADKKGAATGDFGVKEDDFSGGRRCLRLARPTGG